MKTIIEVYLKLDHQPGFFHPVQHWFAKLDVFKSKMENS